MSDPSSISVGVDSPGGPHLLGERFPGQFAAYRAHFVEGFQGRYFNVRTGHIRLLEDQP